MQLISSNLSIQTYTVEPGYGVDLFEGDYLLLPAVDLRMDPASRPHPISSVAFAYFGNSVFVFVYFLWPGAVGRSANYN
jgi:hypothetical protein